MTFNGQAHQQVAHRCKHFGRKLGRADSDAQREIIGMDHDLEHPGEQEVVSAQDQRCQGIGTTSRAVPAASKRRTISSASALRPARTAAPSAASASSVLPSLDGSSGEVDVTHAARW